MAPSEVVCTFFTQTSLQHYDPETMLLEAYGVFETFWCGKEARCPPFGIETAELLTI
jgi:hypothetical protein